MRRHSRIRCVLRVLAWLPAVLACLLALASAYGGAVDPRSCILFAMAAMTFPLTAALLMAVMAVYAALRQTLAADVCALTLVACLPAFANYSPHNSEGDPQGAPVFTVMNFNAYEYYSPETKKIPAPNPSLASIINSGADIVCLQEAVQAKHFVGKYGITQQQIDSLHELYPYSKTTIEMCVYSKLPLREAKLMSKFSRWSVVVLYQVDFHGVPISVLSVHLTSLGLDEGDRALYETLTEGRVRHSGVRRGGKRLLAKFAEAARSRAIMADSLCTLADSIGGNVIICGDFNDLPGCYADRTLRRAGFTDAYAAAGRGAGISYRSNRFWFRIDHVFCRGDLRPLRSRVLREGVSDHYPVVTSFAVDN